MSNYKLVPLCRCNQCMKIFEDTNPQDGAHVFKVPESIDTLKLHNDMRMCPECETDEYLSDVGIVINANYSVETEFSILNELLKWIDKGKIDAAMIDDKSAKKMFVHFKKRIYKELAEAQYGGKDL